jgi:ASC-1-like (ASCH) protein
MIEMEIESTLVEAIRRGEKTIEPRLGKPPFLTIEEGDILSVREDLYLDGNIIDSFSDSLQVIISQVLYFETLREMLQAVDFTSVVPSAKTVEDALAVYKRLYSDEDEKEYGVVALYFDVTT